MEHDSDAGRSCDRPRQSSTAPDSDNAAGDEKRTDGAYVVIDTATHEQHAAGLSKARAESLAREYCDGVEARRMRPDPHWTQRVGGGSA